MPKKKKSNPTDCPGVKTPQKQPQKVRGWNVLKKEPVLMCEGRCWKLFKS